MSRYSMEIKALLEKKRLTRSRIHPQHSINNEQSRKFQKSSIKALKRCQSAMTLRKTSDLASLQVKYRNLEQKYHRMLEETKQKSLIFHQLQDDVKKLTLQHATDQKQIERLKILLGFTPKESIKTQISNTTDSSHIWNATGVQKQSNYGQISEQKISQKCLKRTSKRNENLFSTKRLNDSTTKKAQSIKSPRKQRSPTQAYRFIPSLFFKEK